MMTRAPEEREELIGKLVICSNSRACNDAHISCGHKGPHKKRQDCDAPCPTVDGAKCLLPGQEKKVEGT